MKVCNICRQELLESAFAWRDKAKRILAYTCKECVRKKSKKHYNENKEHYIERSILQRGCVYHNEQERKEIVEKDNLEKEILLKEKKELEDQKEEKSLKLGVLLSSVLKPEKVEQEQEKEIILQSEKPTYDPKRKGDASELFIAGAFIQLGWNVLFPYSDSLPYDMLIEKEGTFLKIQCKTCTQQGEAIVVSLTSVHTINGKAVSQKYSGIDLFVAYSYENKEFYYFPFKEVGHLTQVIIRKEYPSNGQKTNIRLTKDYKTFIWSTEQSSTKKLG